MDFTDDLIETHKNCKKLMPLIHLPIQSGSNKILQAMNRKHTIEEYFEIVNKLKKIKPVTLRLDWPGPVAAASE